MGWNALSSISTLVIVVFTAIALVVSIRSARQANTAAAAATRQANDASAAAIKQANDATAAAIRDANSRAERDLYRDTLIKVAEYLGATQDQYAPGAPEARAKARALVSVLPHQHFPMPIIRTHLSAEGKPEPTPPAVANAVNDPHVVSLMVREVAEGVHLANDPLHQFSRIVDGGATLGAVATLTAEADVTKGSGTSQDKGAGG